MEYRKNKIKLLMVYDDLTDFDGVRRYFSNNDYIIYRASCGREALALSTSMCPDVIVMASRLRDMDSDRIVKKLRSWSDCTVIVMSNAYSVSEEVKLIYAGADDYISISQEEQVINARIYAALRRSLSSGAYKPYRAKQLEIDFNKRQIMFEGHEVHVSPVEYKILECLASNSGNVVTYQMLLNKIWGPYMENDSKILRVNMANIRKKIEPKATAPEYIFTVTRVGYRMLENENNQSITI